VKCEAQSRGRKAGGAALPAESGEEARDVMEVG
jgi:hypothetical protein